MLKFVDVVDNNNDDDDDVDEQELEKNILIIIN